MRPLSTTLLACLLALGAGCSSAGGGSSEIDDYLAEVRRNGMTEGALQSLQTVASIRTGQTLVAYEKDAASGYYIRDYSPASCANPSATPEQLAAYRAEEIAKVMREVERIKHLADFDRSGFVTTEEGRRFRQYYELGLQASYICAHEGCTVEALATGTNLPRQHLEESLRGYAGLQRRAAAESLPDFPVVPL